MVLVVFEVPGPEIRILHVELLPGDTSAFLETERSVPKKGYIGSVSTKTHSGDPDGTGGFGSFLRFWRSLALKFGFYKKFHRQNWLEIVGKQDFGPKKGYIGLWWFWWSPGWVLVLVVPRVGSGTGFGGVFP